VSGRREVRLLHVAGARPNFMKVAPVMAAVEAWNTAGASPMRFSQTLVHTGQHYDAQMSDIFFRDLRLPEPDHRLEIGSGSHAEQTAAVLERIEPVLLAERPDLVVVVGDVNSTLASALCAAKLGLPIAHVEAGLRSGDRGMPEELNRLLTDHLSELLFTTESDAMANLRREGITPARLYFVGNTMIDSLERVRSGSRAPAALAAVGVEPRRYVLVTLHRPSNVDDPARLAALVTTLTEVAERLPLVWPVHVRTRERLREQGHLRRLDERRGFVCCDALAYPEFVALMGEARLVLTDSGGIQEETTVLGVPCLTIRTTTERPVTVSQGTNRLVDPCDGAAIVRAVDDVLAAPMPAAGRRPELWDGHAAERIVAVVADWAEGRAPAAGQRAMGR
jgi:UDP-N-acetylglucosamine 2-epimerase (non-hydrolysing)